MTTFTLCANPVCEHPKRRHNNLGCTVITDAGQCLCDRAADEILDEATTTHADVETIAEPSTGPVYEVDLDNVPATPAPPVATVASLVPAEDILARAQAAGGRLATRAAKIRAMITDLGSDLAEQERLADAERRVQNLRKQYEEAAAQLRELRSGGTKATSAAPAPSNGDVPTDKQLRAWAAQAGVPCGSVGKVGAKVIDAWRAAGSPSLDSGEVAA